MNTPPTTFFRVPHESMHALVIGIGQATGLAHDRADLLASLLVGNDLRGVFSHGTRQIATYARLMRDGKLNPRPDVRIVAETPISLVVDGDGGLGYFPAYDGTLALIEKARAQGIAVMLTRNHGHFGAAGIYARMTLRHDLLAFVTSGHQLSLSSGQPIYAAAGGSPMSFSAPTADEDPVVLDFGAMHDLYADSPHRDEVARLAPGLVLRSIGLGAICQTWGGLLAGVPLDPERARGEWPSANQGSLIVTFRISLFMPPEQLKREVDQYVRAVRKLAPLEGFENAYLPGGVEALREREYRAAGIPVGPEHAWALGEVAAELGVAVPWPRS